MWPPQYPISAKRAGRFSKRTYFRHQEHQQAAEVRRDSLYAPRPRTGLAWPADVLQLANVQLAMCPARQQALAGSRALQATHQFCHPAPCCFHS
jgi:hypothetical protein